MNTTLSIPHVPEIITDRYYSISAAAVVGSNRVRIDRKLENSFEVVIIKDNVYLLTGAVTRSEGLTYYDIYPDLVKPVAVNDRISCIRYNTDKNSSVLSTAQNFDIYSKFFKLAGDLKELTTKLGSVNLQLPLNNYQLALKNGFSGTEAQWLNSIKGKDGISINPAQYVLSTIFNTTVTAIENRLTLLENETAVYSPTSGTMTASDDPLVIIWDTDIIPNDPENVTYLEKHGDLTGTSISVLMDNPGNPGNLIEYPNNWSIDSTTNNILTIDNQYQDAIYSIGFGANGGTGQNTPSQEQRIYNEIPMGAINGSNTDFVSALNFVPESLVVIVNGLTMSLNNDYVNIGTKTIRLTFSMGVGENIVINYTKL